MFVEIFIGDDTIHRLWAHDMEYELRIDKHYVTIKIFTIRNNKYQEEVKIMKDEMRQARVNLVEHHTDLMIERILTKINN